MEKERSSIIKKLIEKLRGDEECLSFLESIIVKINQVSYENEMLRKKIQKLSKIPSNQKNVRFES